jgi:hypothetical protein
MRHLLTFWGVVFFFEKKVNRVLYAAFLFLLYPYLEEVDKGSLVTFYVYEGRVREMSNLLIQYMWSYLTTCELAHEPLSWISSPFLTVRLIFNHSRYARDVRWYVPPAFEGLCDIVIRINLIVAILGSCT